MFKKLIIGLLALSIVFAFSPAINAETDTLIISSPAEATGLDPRLETDVHSEERLNTIMEPLVTYNTDMNLEERLATNWEFRNEGMTLSFELRENVYWHDGEQFTAEDVKYTFEWILDDENNAPNRELYVVIDEIEIEDDYTIHFHLEEVNSFILNNIARISIVPEKHGDNEDFRTNPIGTGPYEFVSWTRDDTMELKANENYWGEEPNIPNIEFRPIPEDSSRQMALEAGEVDVFQGGIVPEELEYLIDQPNVNIERTAGTGYTYLGYNTRKEPLDNVNVRRAISHTVNKEGIVERIQHGIGQKATTPVPSGLPWHNDDIEGYEYDLERAEELLAEEGIDELSVGLHTNENPTRIRIAEILQSELSQIGVEVDVSIEEWGAFWSGVQQPDHDYDLYIVGWVGQVDPDRSMYRQFHSEGGMNFGDFHNERLDELLDQGRLVDPESKESLEIYYEAQEIVAENEFYTPIFYDEEIGVSRPGIEGYEPHPFISMAWQDVHTFSIEH